MSNIDKMSANQQLFTELTSEEGAMIEGGQFTVLLRDDGPVRQELSFRTAGPNPTALQMTNATDLSLSYDLNFDGPQANKSISPKEVQTYFGQDGTATATWDLDLATPGVQARSADLKPGRRYAFYII